jgi:hypothetical protein
LRTRKKLICPGSKEPHITNGQYPVQKQRIQRDSGIHSYRLANDACFGFLRQSSRLRSLCTSISVLFQCSNGYRWRKSGDVVVLSIRLSLTQFVMAQRSFCLTECEIGAKKVHLVHWSFLYYRCAPYQITFTCEHCLMSLSDVTIAKSLVVAVATMMGHTDQHGVHQHPGQERRFGPKQEFLEFENRRLFFGTISMVPWGEPTFSFCV